MVPNWRVLKDGWGRPGTGAEGWLESPEDAIADTGREDRKGEYVRVLATGRGGSGLK